MNKRRVYRSDDGLSFKTPQEWLHDPGVRRRYEGVVFNRSVSGRDAAVNVMGVGHRAFDQALNQARNSSASLAFINGIEVDLAFFNVRDRITDQTGNVRQLLFVVRQDPQNGERIEVLRDWKRPQLFMFQRLVDAQNLEGLAEAAIKPDGFQTLDVAADSGKVVAFESPRDISLACFHWKNTVHCKCDFTMAIKHERIFVDATKKGIRTWRFKPR